MCFISGKNFLKNIYGLENFSAVGVGPGLGRSTHNSKLLKQLFSEFKNTIVIDADGLNTLALDKDLKKALPKNCILTPHPKEFDNLFGRSANDFERLGMAIKVSVATGIYIILKGHRTAIIPPDGKVYFNTTGNAGMAKGGSGDVLTGVLTGLLAQGYNPEEACLLGVYLHGKAGDIASSKFSKESMTPSDIIDFMGDVFKELNTKSLGGNK
jgi:NAD(P)H-hydrate epimerase